MQETLPAVQDVSRVPAVTPLPMGMLSVTVGREAQMVQMAMLSAKRFPRDELTAAARIRRACQRPGLAKVAAYSYKRGDSVISGPSIRLAEAIGQNWGNIDVSWFEVQRHPPANGDPGSSTVLTQAMDLETNSRKSIVFECKHWRDTKSGGYCLTDERDIYELIANQAQRRVRACILAVVPGDVVDDAMDECDRTVQKEAGGKSLADQIKDMTVAFLNDHGVTREMLEVRLQHRLEVTNDTELRTLRKVYTSLRDGMATVKDQFPSNPEVEADLAAKAAAAAARREAQANRKPKLTPAPPVNTTIVEDLRARLKEDGLETMEPQILAFIHSNYLKPEDDFKSLEDVEANEPAAIAGCFRSYPALRKALLFERDNV